MNSLIALLSSFADNFVAACLIPFSSLPPIWGLVSVSVISGVLLLLIYGKISFQGKIRETKRGIGSRVLESVLFRHDLRVSLSAQALMFWGGIKYFLLAIPPLLILMIPCVLILAQLELRYGSAQVKPHQGLVLDLKLSPNTDLSDLSIKADSSVEVSPPVRSKAAGEIAWKLTPMNEGVHRVSVLKGSDSDSIEFVIPVGTRAEKVSRSYYNSSLMRLLYPTPYSFTGKWSPLQSINLAIPSGDVFVAGSFTTHWIIVFLVVSILAGLVAGKIFKVEI